MEIIHQPIGTDYIIASRAPLGEEEAHLTLTYTEIVQPGLYIDAPPEIPSAELKSNADVEEIARSYFEQYSQIQAFRVDSYVQTLEIQGRNTARIYHNDVEKLFDGSSKLIYVINPLINNN